MMRSLAVRMVMILWGMILFGCGWDVGELSPQSTVKVPRDGHLYILNNIRPFGPDWARTFFVVHEGQTFKVPHNMTYDGEPTLVGSVLITPDPLPGGTKLDFDYGIEEMSVVMKKLSASFGGPLTIDGDITIEFYASEWETPPGRFNRDVIVALSVLSGKFDGIHEYNR